MSLHDKIDTELGQRDTSGLLDVLIRAGLILALVTLCYQVFAPFLTLMVWALILAVALYPMHQYLAAKIGGKQGLAATILVLLGITLIIAPTAVLMSSLGDSVHQLINDVQEDTLEIPAPRESSRDVARGRREALCVLVGGVHRPACSDQKPAAEDRRPREDGARLRCRHRRRAAAIPRRLHRRRHHHGLRSGGQPRKPCHLPALRRRRAAAPSSRSYPRQPYAPLHKVSSASPSFRRSSSAFVCCSPAYRGRACWR